MERATLLSTIACWKPVTAYFPANLANLLSELALRSFMPIKISLTDEIARTQNGFESAVKKHVLLFQAPRAYTRASGLFFCMLIATRYKFHSHSSRRMLKPFYRIR